MTEEEVASHVEYSPCKHLSTLDLEKKSELLTSYKFLHGYYVSCVADKDAFKRKAKDCYCRAQACPKQYRRVHACLSCVYYGCFIERHIHHHYTENKTHILAMDTNFGRVFCHSCNDYQYDPDFDKISQRLNLRAAKERGSSLNYKWLPFSDDVKIKKMDVINLSNIGLRGIKNMSKIICYLIVIIQSLIHAPVFRDYFLSSNHKCEKQSTDDTQASCFVCEMSSIVHEFFSGTETTFVPNRLLFLLWQKEPDLLKGEEGKLQLQQDAHQCFLALINKLHEDCTGSSDIQSDDHSCKCIIDTIFTGILMYTYSCTNCRNTFINTESFKDIQLDLKMQSPLSKDDGVSQPVPSASKRYTTNQTTNDNASSSKPEVKEITVIPLDDCLKRSMRSQVHDYKCSNCSIMGIHNTQMTLKQLPIIITFHFKTDDILKKKTSEHKISFPEFLDMTPFMQPSKTQSSDNYSNSNCNSDNLLNGVNGKVGNKFYLFAVVEHTGTGKDGHYRCYVRRHKKNWFFCNDDSVEPIELEKVLMSDAYLLFYHKMVLEYDSKDAQDKINSKNAEDKIDCKDAADKIDSNVIV